MVKSTVDDESRIPNVDADDSIQTYYLRIIPHIYLRHPLPSSSLFSLSSPSSSSTLSSSLSSSYSSTGSI
ncbi:hypothetical protein DY000_02058194 [Brassica cretica]|uniref:Uncharacterized protein n=1 Tax=Brassica cretica TaxID=69181 RepID=A0ABQ7AIL8_BRACR|nr:hypothetical protein DY000_02058194 [Brassica cretica]